MVFDLIVTNAWKNGDPGVVFIDKINLSNPTPQLGEIESTNPCGEQPLLPFESCNLGSINLEEMVIENEKGKKEVNWEKLERVTKTAVHFLDNVVDMSKFPLEQITEMVNKTRKIGLGPMGWADALIKMSVAYDSKEGLELAREIMKLINDTVGHLVGDKALVEAVDVFKLVCRESDIIARIGGNKFVILVTSQEKKDSDAFLARLKKSISDCNFRPTIPGLPRLGQMAVGIGISTGVATELI